MPLIFLLCFFFGAFYISWYYLEETKKRKYSPPGPFNLPFIGSSISLGLAHSKPHLSLVKLAEKYGDVMRLKLGSYDYVVLSSAEALKDLLNKDETLGRPDHGILRDRADVPNTGIALSTGEACQARRRWLNRNLREMGVGRTSYFEETTKEMVKEFHGQFYSNIPSEGKVVTVNRKLALCAGTMMWRLLVGSHTPQDDADCEAFLYANEKWLEYGVFGDGLLIMAPFLKYFLPHALGYTAQMEFMKVGKNIAKKWYDTLKKLDFDSPKSFLHTYLFEEKKGNPHFFEADFIMCFNDILAGSVETSNSFLQSLMMFLTCYPDKQQKLYDEITNNFPADHEFTIGDLKSMPYTQAFMLETHRLTMLATNWIPHTLTADITYRGYTLKKGTTLLPNPHGAFKQMTHFGPDPESFRPERFIDPNSPSTLNELKQLVTPFSIGKRSCPGESIAQLLAFITLVSTVKKFKLAIVPEEPPSQQYFVGLTSRPHPFKAFITRR